MSDPEKKQYEVLNPITHGGDAQARGTVLSLTDEDARRYGSDTVRPVDGSTASAEGAPAEKPKRKRASGK